MQNHVDATLTHQPGYRDRIVHAHDRAGRGRDEPCDATARDRGADAPRAGGRAALVERFAETPAPTGPLVGQPPLGALPERAHRLAEQLEQFGSAWRATPDGERSYPELVDRPTTSARTATGSSPTEQRPSRWPSPSCSRRPATGRRPRTRPSTGRRRDRAGLPHRPGRLSLSARRRPSRAAARRSPTARSCTCRSARA
jgi:hypothetical protein